MLLIYLSVFERIPIYLHTLDVVTIRSDEVEHKL